MIEGVCNESKLLSSLFLRVKPYELLRGTLLLFSEHVRSLELLPCKFVWSNELLDGIKLAPKLRKDCLSDSVLIRAVIRSL